MGSITALQDDLVREVERFQCPGQQSREKIDARHDHDHGSQRGPSSTNQNGEESRTTSTLNHADSTRDILAGQYELYYSHQCNGLTPASTTLRDGIRPPARSIPPKRETLLAAVDRF